MVHCAKEGYHLQMGQLADGQQGMKDQDAGAGRREFRDSFYHSLLSTSNLRLKAWTSGMSLRRGH